MSFGSGGGSSRISTSADVALSNPVDGQALIYDGTAQKWVNLVIPGTIALNKQTGTAYTIALTDIGSEIEMNSASANTVTIPAQSSVIWPIGSNVNVRQMGAGQTTIVGANGVTLRTPNGAKLAAQYTTATIIRSASDVWIVDGGVTT